MMYCWLAGAPQIHFGRVGGVERTRLRVACQSEFVEAFVISWGRVLRRPFPLAAGPLQMFYCSIFDGNQCSNLDGSGQEKDLKLWEFFFENIVQLPNFGS